MGLNPVMELVKLPVPVPSTVLLLEVVGEAIVLQQTPLAVTVDPPSEETLPPLVAEVVETDETEVVVIVGRMAVSEKETSFPYAVPALLVA